MADDRAEERRNISMEGSPSGERRGEAGECKVEQLAVGRRGLALALAFGRSEIFPNQDIFSSSMSRLLQSLRRALRVTPAVGPAGPRPRSFDTDFSIFQGTQMHSQEFQSHSMERADTAA